jgi:hypothetical protein
MGTLAVLDRTHGDLTIGWDPNSAPEIEQAQASFDSLIAEGHMAYKTTKDGGKGEQIHKFDPKAERIVMSPPLVGG